MNNSSSKAGLLRRAGAGLGLALLAALATSATATATAAPPPQLSIAVDNGHTSTKSGDRLDYTITIKNLGTSAVKSLAVTQTVPPGLTFTSADAAGSARAGVVTWRIDLRSAGATALHTSMTVSATPQNLLRLATVACAGKSRGAPVVCATHSDRLPAGAAAEAEATRSAARSTRAPEWRYYCAGGLGAVALLAGALVIHRRRKRHAT